MNSEYSIESISYGIQITHNNKKIKNQELKAIIQVFNGYENVIYESNVIKKDNILVIPYKNLFDNNFKISNGTIIKINILADEKQIIFNNIIDNKIKVNYYISNKVTGYLSSELNSLIINFVTTDETIDAEIINKGMGLGVSFKVKKIKEYEKHYVILQRRKDKQEKLVISMDGDNNTINNLANYLSELSLHHEDIVDIIYRIEDDKIIRDYFVNIKFDSNYFNISQSFKYKVYRGKSECAAIYIEKIFFPIKEMNILDDIHFHWIGTKVDNKLIVKSYYHDLKDAIKNKDKILSNELILVNLQEIFFETENKFKNQMEIFFNKICRYCSPDFIIIYDEKNNIRYRDIIHRISPGTKYITDIDELKSEKFNIILDESIFCSTKNIKYIFKESNCKSNKLLVVFSGYATENEALYNYIRQTDSYDVNKLYILDDYGDIGIGCYYIGENKSYDIEVSIMSLITYYMNKLDIKLSNVISMGRSKGGAVALYFGMKYNFGNILAGAFQFNVGSFLNRRMKSNFRKNILHYISGETTDDGVEYCDNIYRKVTNHITTNNIQLHIVEHDPYNKFLYEIIEIFNQENIRYNLDIAPGNVHVDKDTIEYFNKFIREKLEEMVNN